MAAAPVSTQSTRRNHDDDANTRDSSKDRNTEIDDAVGTLQASIKKSESNIDSRDGDSASHLALEASTISDVIMAQSSTDVEIMVVDSFTVDPSENPTPTHGDKVSYVASISSNSEDVSVKRVDYNSDLSVLQQIAASEDPPEVVNLSWGKAVSINFLRDYDSLKEEFIADNDLQQGSNPGDWSESQLAGFKLKVETWIDEKLNVRLHTQEAYQQALQDLVNAGVTVVIAAGNDRMAENILYELGIEPPDGFYEGVWKDVPEGVIVVGATETNSATDVTEASFTSPTPEVDVAADGTDVEVSSGGLLAGGTSFAAPQVSGLVADMIALDPSLTPAEIERILKQAASNPTGASSLGEGVVDRDEALLMVQLWSVMGYPETVRVPSTTTQPETSSGHSPSKGENHNKPASA
jgi:subtilisin family serine protease